MSHLTTTDGTTLFYRDWGHGRPLVFLASWALDSSVWERHMLHFNALGFRCIALDRRGHGRSDDTGRGYRLDRLADDVAELVEQLDLREATLIAHSMASGEATRYLARHGSGRVTRAIFLAPVARLLWRPRIVGRRNVPRSGPVLIASNHRSFIDSVVITLVAPRSVSFLAKAEYFTGRGFRGRVSRAFFSGIGAIPVVRGAGSAAQDALDSGLRVLDAGGAFAIYPEGTRSLDGRIYRGRTGVAWLAFSLALPATATALAGTRRVEAGRVGERPAPTGEARCPYTLVVGSASIARPMIECVSRPVWARAVVGGPVTLTLVAGPFGAEVAEVGP